MQFSGYVKGVTVNVAKKTISLSFQVTMNVENMEAAEALAFHVDKGPVILLVNAMQAQLSLGEPEKKHHTDV